MKRIRVLDPVVVDRIAAGEVVERPASVVKELIENSLDAGATRVEVRVDGGGSALLEVSDDGHGMQLEDAVLAFTQHATSKISDVDDLDHILTLGFRGEALASIAAVARVDMVTSTGEGPAARVRVEGGSAPKFSSRAAPRGTRVQVRELFFNTPARRKHLRTDVTELSQVTSVVQEFSLLRPDVHFRLLTGDRERLQAPPVSTLAERIHQVLGPDVAGSWIPVDRSGSRVRVHGGVTGPEYSRADRRQIYLFVNGRVIADGRLGHAVVSAFDTLLDRRRYPVAALFVELPAEDVDVNVHPRKAEVRFVQPGRVYGSLRGAVQQALAQHLPPPTLRFDSQFASSDGLTASPSDPGSVSGWHGRGAATTLQRASLPVRDWLVTEGAPAAFPATARADGSPGELDERPICGTQGAIQPLGQYANTYILAADERGLLIIDQHVAHERILYEKVLAQRRERRLQVQRLLIVETLELTPVEAAAAQEHGALLAEFGFEIEPFGGRTWAIGTVPEMLGSRGAEAAVRALLASLSEQRTPDAVDRMHREVAASVACHSAVRANQPLTAQAMSQLIADLGQCAAPNRCPHGRPIMMRVDHGDIERLLHRH